MKKEKPKNLLSNQKAKNGFKRYCQKMRKLPSSFLLAAFIFGLLLLGRGTLTAQDTTAPTSSCDDPIEVNSMLCGTSIPPNTPSGSWAGLDPSGVQTILFGFPGGDFIDIDFNCLSDDTDVVGDLEIRLASSAYVAGSNTCNQYLQNVYDVRDAAGNEALNLITILVEFTGCSTDADAGPMSTCTEFSMTYSDCPDGLGPNTPDGSWYPIGPSGSVNNAVGGSYTMILDLSSCISDNCTPLSDIEYTLQSSFAENIVPGCSMDIINVFKVRDAAGIELLNAFSFRGTIQFTPTAPPMITCPANTIAECGSTDPMFTGMPTAISDCGSASFTYNDVVTGAGSCMTQITRTWTATDACGSAFVDFPKIQTIQKYTKFGLS